MIIKKIRKCARCGEEHEQVEMLEFARPVKGDFEHELLFTHWAPCPCTGEPILLKVVPETH